MTRVVTFGEAMIRMSPPGSRRLEQAESLELWVAGAELNVAVALARLGCSSSWVSRLPDNALGRKVAAHARACGVETGGVRWAADGRVGLFFTEVGHPPRPSATLYDRERSAFAQLDPAEFDWPALIAGADALHTSGITAAISEACARALGDALACARRLGCHTSYDLNYRSLLTTPGEARAAVEALAPHLDTVIASAGEASQVFGLAGESCELAERLRDRLGVPRAVVSSRVPRADGNQLRRSASADGTVEEALSPEFRTVDPLGGGDAFSAGFLAGLLGGGARRGLELGGALAALKQSIPGDSAIVDRAEVERLLEGAGGETRR